MPWWDFLKRNEKRTDATGEERATTRTDHQIPPLARSSESMPVPPAGSTGSPIIGRRPTNPDDPAVRERRRRRLERRIQDLQYDIRQAETARQEPNRWSERVEELNRAIEQARHDADAVLSVPPGWTPHPLPAWPVTIERVRPEEPAEISFHVGEFPFRYTEELDWAERGHQKAPPQLRRVEGDIERLLPDDVPNDRRDELREHLAHGLSTLATLIRDNALEDSPQPSYTLSDLASPCPECGGWRDLKGRCPACQEREWEADRLREEMQRLVQERNDQLEELQRMRERLPILRRQFAETQAELARMTES